VEGVSDALLARQLGRVWAAGDESKHGFIDSLTITILGSRVGRWPADLLATPGHELVERVAVLRDTDDRQSPSPPSPPSWITDKNQGVIREFASHPTLEPTLVPGNEEAVVEALGLISVAAPSEVTAERIDQLFGRQGAARGKKAQFSAALCEVIDQYLIEERPIVVPDQFEAMFEFLFEGEGGTGDDSPGPD
jgi:putative ATP-dependent endonuclease of OLD family